MFEHLPIDRQLAQIFLTSARCACFRQTARSLNLHVTLMRRQLMKLEASIGSPLFRYENRKLLLSPTGKALQQALIERFGDLSPEVASTRRRRIRLAVPSDLLDDFLARDLIAWLRKDAAMNLEILPQEGIPEQPAEVTVWLADPDSPRPDPGFALSKPTMLARLHYCAHMAFLSGSVFSENNDDTDGDSVKRYNLRGVFAPMNQPGNVLHIVAQFAYRDLKDAAVDTRIRPRMGMRGVETNGGSDAGDNGNRGVFGGMAASEGLWKDDSVWGVEGAWAMDAFSVQAEYLSRKLKADEAEGDVDASGYYGQVAYTLTGEPRVYKLDGAKFDTIKPANKQTGAWEVFYRYDSITVDDENVTTSTATRQVGDAEGNTHTLGVNWYANEAVKISANYVKASTENVTNENGDDSGDGMVMRLQYVF